MNYQAMNRQRKFLLFAAAAGVISVFLPWLTFSAGTFLGDISNSVNGFRGTGILVFIIFLSTGVLTFIGDQSKPLERTYWLLVLAAGVVSLICIIAAMFGKTGEMNLGFFFGSHPGIGLWLALVANLVILATTFLLKGNKETIRDSFQQLKSNISSAISSATAATTTKTSKMDELEKLIELKNQGKITEEEYRELKSKII